MSAVQGRENAGGAPFRSSINGNFEVEVGAPGGGDFEQAPVGLAQAVCIDVIDRGLHDEEYTAPNGEKTLKKDVQKIEIRWQLADVDEQGRRFRVSKWYTYSMHEKATMRKDLEAWRGAPFKPGDKFNIENLIGVNCMINVGRTAKDRAKVVSIAPHKTAFGPKIEAHEYTRERDRATEDAEAAAITGEGNGAIEDEQPPF